MFKMNENLNYFLNHKFKPVLKNTTDGLDQWPGLLIYSFYSFSVCSLYFMFSVPPHLCLAAKIISYDATFCTY